MVYKERKNLNRLGFIIKVFEISENKVKMGLKQLVFKRDEAILIEEKNLTDLT